MNEKRLFKFDLKIFFLFVIIFLGIFIPILITWLYVGEINLSKNNWLVALNGKMWGLVLNENGDQYWGYGISKVWSISWQPFIIGFAILLFNILAWIILLKFRLTKINFLTHIVSTWMLFYLILITGSLTYNMSWTIPVRILIIIVGYFIFFIGINYLNNRIILKTSFAANFGNEIIKNEIENQEYANKYLKNKKDKSNRKKTVTIDTSEL